jgi:hypothetical protein
MNEIVSRDEVLEGYYKFDNIDELFYSDILILPVLKPVTKQDEGRFYNQPLSTDIKREFPEVTAKCYCRSQEAIPVHIENQFDFQHYLGSIVVLTPFGMYTLYKYIIDNYKQLLIKVDLHIKIGDNLFLNASYEGKASDIETKINEILTKKKITSYQPVLNQSKLNDPDLIRNYNNFLTMV